MTRIIVICRSCWMSRISFSTLACTVTSSAVVGSSAKQQAGLAGEGHRDHHPLAHPTAQLEGIGPQALLRRRDVHRLEELEGPFRGS